MKLHRIVVNCGLTNTGRDSWRQVARGTAAHSTATFNDTSSARLVESGAIRRMLHFANDFFACVQLHLPQYSSAET